MAIIGAAAERRGRTLRRMASLWRGLFALAWPVMLSRAGTLIISLTAVVVVGRYDTLALGQLALGTGVFLPMAVAGIGMMTGLLSVVSRGAGAGEANLPDHGLRGLWWAGLIGAIGALPVFAGEAILTMIGQTPDLAVGGGAVARWLAPGVFLHMIFVGASVYLEGTGRTKPGLVAMAVATAVNLALCLVLVEGRFGAPEMGAPGAALAATIARGVMALGLVVWLLRLPEFQGRLTGLMRLWGPGGWRAGAEMRRIGLAGGAAFFFETIAFASLGQAAGILGPTALAAYTILHNVEATVFMVALGLSVATGVRVGQAAGRRDGVAAREIAVAGLSLAMTLALGLGLVLLAFAPQAAGLFTHDAGLIARAAPLFAILSVTMIFDSGQVVLGQTARTLGDAWATTAAYMAAFWLVMIPSALVLAFPAGMAEAGLFVGTGLGCAAAVTLLALRVRRRLAGLD
jgi:MATE family multidrug resistance protein